jgi:hypothetical protein
MVVKSALLSAKENKKCANRECHKQKKSRWVHFSCYVFMGYCGRKVIGDGDHSTCATRLSFVFWRAFLNQRYRSMVSEMALLLPLWR